MHFRLSALVVAILLSAIALQAQPTIDQEQVQLDVPGSNTLALGGASHQVLRQTFVAGKSGYLSHLTFPIACSAGSTVVVKVTGPGVNASATVPAVALPGTVGTGFRIVQFCQPPRIKAGVRYAISLTAQGSCGMWSAPAGDTYTAGELSFLASPNTTWAPMTPVRDMAFQTFVCTKPCCCSQR